MAGIDINALEWDAPGPGSWTPDGTHTPKPVTKHLAETEHGAFFAGFSETMRRYGMPILGLKQECVNGFLYGGIVPAPMEEIPERAETAATAFETKLWRDDLRRWDDEVKPAAVRRHRDLGAVDLDALDDEGLISHLLECRDHHSRMITQHHQFNGAAMMPLGDFLARAGAWTGLPPGRLLALFKGASPISTGQCEELTAAAAAINADESARQLLADSTQSAAATLTALRTFEGKVGEAVEDWVSLVGHRLIDGFDVSCPTAIEQPESLVAQLRAAVFSPLEKPDIRAERAAVREAVPAEHRDEFDDALDEALLTYRVRDERGVYSDITAAGLVRRAMLGAGRRLADRGALSSAELAVEASVEELADLLRGTAGAPTSEDLEARADYRRRYSIDDIPPLLGDPPSPPPPLEMLPPPMARATVAFMTVIGHLFQDSEAEHDEAVVRGIGASGGVHRGRARVIATIEDLGEIEDGDVLVTVTTSEAFNCAIALVSAVVTEHGGMLSHAAILAREYGMPAVVGTRDCTSRIPDGAVIEVDGTVGEVRLLG
jgi:rifampicin phosphotransferase